MKTRFTNVTVENDRHGKLRAVFRKGGKKSYMKRLPDQPGFEAEYNGLKEGRATVDVRSIPRSIGDLCPRYYKSGAFIGQSSPEDRKRRKGILEPFRNEFANDLVADFEFEHIEAVLIAKTEKRKVGKRLVGGEVAASNLRKELQRLFGYAKKLKWIAGNPVEDADRIGRKKLVGFYAWSEDDIAAFKEKHALGTKARLALEIILWTGKRRGDARLFGPKHIMRGKIHFQPGKTAKDGRDLWLPIAPDLRRAIDAMPSVGISSYLVTEWGRPFTKDGFGNKMRDWCDEAGLPRCTAHGLRKAIARRMAESEASQQGIKAVGGWRGDVEVSTYTESASQERMAEIALGRAIGRFSDPPQKGQRE